MIEMIDVEDMIGADVLDRDDDRIGEVRQVFVDAESEQPTWVGVRVGLLGAEVLVPLDGADWDESTVRADVTRTCARSAPAVDLDEPLTEQGQDLLLRHYGIPHTCTPRSELDLSVFDGDAISYSVDDRADDTDSRASAAAAHPAPVTPEPQSAVAPR